MSDMENIVLLPNQPFYGTIGTSLLIIILRFFRNYEISSGSRLSFPPPPRGSAGITRRKSSDLARNLALALGLNENNFTLTEILILNLISIYSLNKKMCISLQKTEM